MKNHILCWIILNIFCTISYAQNCNNWLNTPSIPSFAKVGQINITGTKITVEATFNRTAPYVGGFLYAGDLVSKHNTPLDANYLLRPNEAEITTSNGYFRTPLICEIELNKTYHVAMVYDGTTLKFYRNGFLMSQIAASGDLFQNNWQTLIGWYDPQSVNTNFIGYINEVRIWNVAKTQAEIRSYMNLSLPSPTTQTGLVAYYTFDNLLNKQGNPTYNGTLVGSASINKTNSNCNFIADSCGTIPVSITCNTDFSYKQDICNPLSVQFFNIGDAAATTFWSFGDGTTVTGNATPFHTYTSPGNYIVKFNNKFGSCNDTVSKTISVSITTDDLVITPDTTICFKGTKQLHTRPVLSFCWSPTTYLNDPLSANPVTSSPQPITYYFTAEVQGTNIITNGDFNLGNTGFSSQYNFANPNITEGQYFVGPTPQTWNASLSNCTDHTTGTGNMMLVNGAPVADVNVWKQTVTVVPNTNYAFSTWIQALYPPNPAQLSFSINGSNLGNLITASLPTCTWNQFYTTWNSGNNTSATISIVNKNTFVQGNDFALDDISFSPVLIKRDSVKISIDTPRVTTIADTATCPGKSVQLSSSGATNYSWLPVIGLSNANIGNPIATPSNTTQYIVSGTNVWGCKSSDTLNIFIKSLPVITKSIDTTICRNTTAQLIAGGGSSYSWLPAGSLNNAAIANPIASPNINTTYQVTVTGANSCIKTDSVKIAIKALPAFSVSQDKSTCLNKGVSISANGGSSYVWSPAALVNNPTISNPTTSNNVTTAFTVKIKENTCNDSASLTTTVFVLPAPVVKASKTNDIDCVFSSAQLVASGANSYTWTPATGLNNANIFNPLASITTIQQYLVTGTDSVTKCTGNDTVTVLIKGIAEPTFFVPNAFSPNGDGLNDCFGVKHFGTVKTVDISIYHRMGNLVFHTTNVNECWDGTIKGKRADTGNYVYYIKTFNDCGVNIKKGNLLLIR